MMEACVSTNRGNLRQLAAKLEISRPPGSPTAQAVGQSLAFAVTIMMGILAKCSSLSSRMALQTIVVHEKVNQGDVSETTRADQNEIC